MCRIRWSLETAPLQQKRFYDPQTSGGLLASVDKEDVPAIMEELEKLGLPCGVVGEILPKQEKAVIIQ